jgi:hypothetical protein
LYAVHAFLVKNGSKGPKFCY